MNMQVLPTLGFDENEYASEVLLVGAGEGRDSVTAHVPGAADRLRRVAVMTDKSVRSKKTATRLAREELAARVTEGAVSNMVIIDSPNCPIDLLQPGDTIRATGPLATGAFLDHDVRIIELTRALDDFSTASLVVVTEGRGSLSNV